MVIGWNLTAILFCTEFEFLEIVESFFKKFSEIFKILLDFEVFILNCK